MLEDKKLEERKFVAFDAAVIDKNLIVAAVEITQEVGQPDGKRAVVPVTAVLLENGSRVTLGGSSREKFIYWWRENVNAEKVELPEPPASETVVDVEAIPPVAPPTPTPVPTPASKDGQVTGQSAPPMPPIVESSPDLPAPSDPGKPSNPSVPTPDEPVAPA